jgi:hypothetical protein
MAINAASLARELDKSAAEWTVAGLHRTFLDHGCAVVRDVIPIARLAATRDAISAAYEKTADPHVHDPDIRSISGGKLSGFELVDLPLLKGFLGRIFRGRYWKEHSVSARRVQGTELDQQWQRPLDLHLDCQVHSFLFTVNFWIPFDECGVHAPSVQLVPISYKETRAYAGYTGTQLRSDGQWNEGYFPGWNFRR